MTSNKTDPTEPIVTMLDLSRSVKSDKVTILAGKEKGLDARQALKVDSLFEGNAIVVIRVPSTLEAISSSFINGLLGETVGRIVANADSPQPELGGFSIGPFLDRIRIDAAPGIIDDMIRDLELGQLKPLVVRPAVA